MYDENISFFRFYKKQLDRTEFFNFFRDKLRAFQNKRVKKFTKNISISWLENCSKSIEFLKFFGLFLEEFLLLKKLNRGDREKQVNILPTHLVDPQYS